eukprot:TRINITY_DN4887_c0_g2_i1.p1 TRINITY_DN4887_c0_g2~~TRINITY_DN4887_c0_g2_i1.p1  ORF type:complete len:272 (+),score=46.37 TRINITY_DN4887_c0_g2_i1:91-906(+)
MSTLPHIASGDFAIEGALALIRQRALETPLVDGHCHNLVGDFSSLSFLSVFTEAEGDALKDAHESLAFKRGVREAAEALGLERGTSMDQILAHRAKEGQERVAARVLPLMKADAVLVDDGLSLSDMKPYEWFRRWVPCVKRILRIEAVAEQILYTSRGGQSQLSLQELLKLFMAAIDPYPSPPPAPLTRWTVDYTLLLLPLQFIDSLDSLPLSHALTLSLHSLAFGYGLGGRRQHPPVTSLPSRASLRIAAASMSVRPSLPLKQRQRCTAH